MGRLSRRTRGLAESATMRVARLAQELRAAGREIVDFSAGEPDSPSPAVAVEAARRALADGFTKYTPAAGTTDLRRAVAERFQRDYGAPWEARHALITVGGKAALFQGVLALIDDGDDVVLPTPAWVSFEEQVRFAGGRPVRVPTSGDDAFTIHADAVLAAITPATRMILLNSPSNPTGGMISAADLRRIVVDAAERGLVVLCDETYEHFVYDGEHASCATLAREHPDTVVLVGSFSKTYSMTGWRLGFFLGPEWLVPKVIEIQSHATSNPTSFAMVGAQAALANAGEDVRRMIAEFRRRRDFVVARLQEIPGVECRAPRGAFYVFPRVAGLYRDGRRGSSALAEDLLDRAGVAVVPGAAFGDDDHVRLSFACSWESLEKGCARMAEAWSP